MSFLLQLKGISVKKQVRCTSVEAIHARVWAGVRVGCYDSDHNDDYDYDAECDPAWPLCITQMLFWASRSHSGFIGRVPSNTDVYMMTTMTRQHGQQQRLRWLTNAARPKIGTILNIFVSQGILQICWVKPARPFAQVRINVLCLSILCSATQNTTKWEIREELFPVKIYNRETRISMLVISPCIVCMKSFFCF